MYSQDKKTLRTASCATVNAVLLLIYLRVRTPILCKKLFF